MSRDASPSSPALAWRWALATALAGALLGALEGGTRFGASLVLTGLFVGVAQQLAAPRAVPGAWSLVSALAWPVGALADGVWGVGEALPASAIWLLPSTLLAVWQAPLLGPLRRTWPWIPVTIAAAPLLQIASDWTCAHTCDAALAAGGPAAAVALVYGVGFLVPGLATGLLLRSWHRGGIDP